MNIENIHDALNLLDDEMIESVDKLRDEKAQIIKMRRKKTWIRWVPIAACLCLIVSVYVTNGFGLISYKGVGSDSSTEISSDRTHDGEGMKEIAGKGENKTEDYSSLYEKEMDDARLAECSNGKASMSLVIPVGWEYEVIEPIEEDADEFGICFWPEGENEGKIKLMYYEAWGVCGTGLEEIKIQLGEHSAFQGTYDNKEVWDYICYTDTIGHFVALNEGADVWWEEYGTEAMNILSTIQIIED